MQQRYTLSVPQLTSVAAKYCSTEYPSDAEQSNVEECGRPQQVYAHELFKVTRGTREKESECTEHLHTSLHSLLQHGLVVSAEQSLSKCRGHHVVVLSPNHEVVTLHAISS